MMMIACSYRSSVREYFPYGSSHRNLISSDIFSIDLKKKDHMTMNKNIYTLDGISIQ